MATIKSQKLTDKQLMETIDSINNLSGVELDQAADLVLKNGKVDKINKKVLQEAN